ncbi:uncharacterized protein [Pyxicephalus adspersus]|uniref:uncharacterized protein n=1 Tax=Pyxicephalus adspersus TaxID=30357 RepID=UPI003B595BE3
MRLTGDHGKSKTHFLQHSLYSRTTSSTGQVFSSCIKEKDVGELKQIMLGVNRKDCRCYCTNIFVMKAKTNYEFPCNKWLSDQIGMVCARERDSLDRHSETETKDKENHQTQIKTYRTSFDSSNAFDYNNNQFLVTSNMADLSSGKSSKKVEKVKAEDIANKISSTETEMSQKVKANNIEVFQKGNTKSAGSPKRNTNKASKRTIGKRHSSTEMKRQDGQCSKGETSVIGNQNGKHQRESHQIPVLEDTHFNIMTVDESVAEPMLDNNTTEQITEKTEHTQEDLQEQKKIQTDNLPKLEPSRASSPPSLLFFSRERQLSLEFDGVDVNSMRSTGSSVNPNSGSENPELDQTKQRAKCSSVDINKDNDGNRPLQLYLLQQILLESEDNMKASSPGAKSQPFNDYVENPEETQNQHEKSDQSNTVHNVHAHIAGCGDLHYQLDTEDIQNSGCLCSCEDCYSYMSDSTLNEEYLFFDSPLALSFSEDEDTKEYRHYHKADL